MKTYNNQQKEAFKNLFKKAKEKGDIYELVISKLYRCSYCNVGNDLANDIIKWVKDSNLNVDITEDVFQYEIELKA